jgi:hypothetical protein
VALAVEGLEDRCLLNATLLHPPAGPHLDTTGHLGQVAVTLPNRLVTFAPLVQADGAAPAGREQPHAHPGALGSPGLFGDQPSPEKAAPKGAVLTDPSGHAGEPWSPQVQVSGLPDRGTGMEASFSFPGSDKQGREVPGKLSMTGRGVTVTSSVPVTYANPGKYTVSLIIRYRSGTLYSLDNFTVTIVGSQAILTNPLTLVSDPWYPDIQVSGLPDGGAGMEAFLSFPGSDRQGQEVPGIISSSGGQGTAVTVTSSVPATYMSPGTYKLSLTIKYRSGVLYSLDSFTVTVIYIEPPPPP